MEVLGSLERQNESHCVSFKKDHVLRELKSFHKGGKFTVESNSVTLSFPSVDEFCPSLPQFHAGTEGITVSLRI